MNRPGVEAGARAKEVAEVAAAHPVLAGQDVDADRPPRVGEHPLRNASSSRSRSPSGSLSCCASRSYADREFEQRQLHVEAVAEVLAKGAAHETHRAGDQRAARRRLQHGPGLRDLLRDPADRYGW